MNTKPFAASESVMDTISILEGMPLHHEESHESNYLSYISEQKHLGAVKFKDARSLDCEKYSQMPGDEVILSEQKQFHVEENG
ncbi:hypothetical protein TNCV_2479731 [Trichonephila clavipes]|nr:hypothetical protein TNCV_2479731 [Trichonephila clavipes]